jgi:hypothetical protein
MSPVPASWQYEIISLFFSRQRIGASRCGLPYFRAFGIPMLPSVEMLVPFFILLLFSR